MAANDLLLFLNWLQIIGGIIFILIAVWALFAQFEVRRATNDLMIALIRSSDCNDDLNDSQKKSSDGQHGHDR